MEEKKKFETKTLVMCAILTAIVVVLQMLGSFVRFGPFSISLVLVPIVIGSAVCGKWVGAWLGFVFSLVVLMYDSAAFLAIDVFGTVITVVLKGTLAGFMAGLVYSLLEGRNKNVAVIVAAVVCPIVNTGIFLLGCKFFFMGTITQWAAQLGFPSAGNYMIYGLVGGNFLFEMLFNIVLAPVVIRLLDIKRV